MTKKDRIKNFAEKMGFFRTGFAEAGPLSVEYKKYLEWLDSNYEATMHYMGNYKEKRQDIREMLPGARSVIVFAFNYNTEFKHTDNPNDGKISRYAWGTDYHDILKHKLKYIAEFLEILFPGSESLYYVDTGPILEKAWAVKAGIGWQGKNSLILNKNLGSYFFLAEIITTAVFEYDKPESDHCGKCDLCMKACPTGALIDPGVLDSNKCISYWTIEAKPDIDIPDEIGGKLNNYIFGCDICQEVCPWNQKKAVNIDDKRFFPRQGETSLNFAYILDMSQEEFSTRFSKSAVKRPKIAGLKRNAKTILKFKNR